MSGNFRMRILFVIFFIITFSISCFCDVTKNNKKKIEILEKIKPILERLISSYNKRNYKMFFDNFPDTMKAIKSEEAFNLLFLKKYFDIFGKIKKYSLYLKKSKIYPELAILVYKVECEKKEGKLLLSLLKKGGKFYITNFKIIEFNGN